MDALKKCGFLFAISGKGIHGVFLGRNFSRIYWKKKENFEATILEFKEGSYKRC